MVLMCCQDREAGFAALVRAMVFIIMVSLYYCIALSFFKPAVFAAAATRCRAGTIKKPTTTHFMNVGKQLG